MGVRDGIFVVVVGEFVFFDFLSVLARFCCSLFGTVSLYLTHILTQFFSYTFSFSVCCYCCESYKQSLITSYFFFLFHFVKICLLILSIKKCFSA